MPQNSKDSWQAITTLKEGISGHHKSPDIIRLFNKDGISTTIDEVKVKVLSKKFHGVYNRDVSIDWSVLKKIIKIKKSILSRQFNAVFHLNFEHLF